MQYYGTKCFVSRFWTFHAISIKWILDQIATNSLIHGGWGSYIWVLCISGHLMHFTTKYVSLKQVTHTVCIYDLKKGSEGSLTGHKLFSVTNFHCPWVSFIRSNGKCFHLWYYLNILYFMIFFWIYSILFLIWSNDVCLPHVDVNCLFCLYFTFICSFISLFMYSLGTDVIVQVITGEPLKALMLLCRGNLSNTDCIVQICCSKPPKALMLWCRGALFSFQFWDGKQNLVPNMWQIVFANVSIERRVAYSDVNGFFDGSGHTTSIPSYTFDVFHWCCKPVALLCSNVGGGAFRCSLYLSSKVLADSPMYLSSDSVLPHLYQYMMLLCFVMASLSFGNINRFLKCFHPWSIPGLHTCYKWSCSFHIGLWYKVPQCDISSVSGWWFCLGLFHFSFFFVLVVSVPC